MASPVPQQSSVKAGSEGVQGHWSGVRQLHDGRPRRTFCRFAGSACGPRGERFEAGDRLVLFYPAAPLRRLFPPDGRFPYLHPAARPRPRVPSLAARTPSPVAARVRTLGEDALAGTDLFVVDVVVRGAEGHRVVEVFVDGPDGAGIDALAETSRRLSFLLDAEDVVPGAYRLDVSSPGADRPLVDPRQYARHAGRTLRVSYMAEANDPGEEVTLTGVLRAAGPEALTLEVAGHSDAVDVPYSAIRDARVVLPW